MTYEIYIVFFFDNEESVKEFLIDKNPDICVGRKMFRGESTDILCAADIIADLGIYAPIFVVYSLNDAEPVIFRVGDKGVESAS